jgi:hypothetical protein
MGFDWEQNGKEEERLEFGSLIVSWREEEL